MILIETKSALRKNLWLSFLKLKDYNNNTNKNFKVEDQELQVVLEEQWTIALTIEMKVGWINLYQTFLKILLDLRLKKLQSFLIISLIKKDSYHQEFMQWLIALVLMQSSLVKLLNQCRKFWIILMKIFGKKYQAFIRLIWTILLAETTSKCFLKVKAADHHHLFEVLQPRRKWTKKNSIKIIVKSIKDF